MKFLGVVFVLFSGLFFGLELSGTLKKRIELLDSLCSSLEIMHAELNTRPCSVKSICEILSTESGEASKLYKNVAENIDRLGNTVFYDIWKEAVNSTMKSLGVGERHIIENLGTVLGAYDLSEQLNGIELCRNRLSSSLTQLNESYFANRKLYIGLGCSISAMLTIILV